MPFYRSDLIAVTVDQNIYLLGGSPNEGHGSDVVVPNMDVFSPTLDSWFQKSNMSNPRYRFAGALLDDQIYVTGGRSGQDKIVTINEVYDVYNDEWTVFPSLNQNRSDHGCFVLDGKIYVVGGYSEDYSILDTIEMYDPKNSTNGWVVLPERLNAARGDFSVITLHNKVYVVGGFGIGWNLLQNTSLEQYDPEIGQWQVKSPMLTPRGDKGGAIWNEKLLVTGGEIKNEKGESISIDKTEIYDPTSDSWAYSTPLLESRFRIGSATLNNVPYIFGGHDSNFRPLSDVECFGGPPPADDIGLWEEERKMPDAVSDLVAIGFDNKIYVIGGSPNEGHGSDNVLRKTVEYDIKENKWTAKADMHFSRYRFAGAELDGKIYVTGGRNSSDGIVRANEVYDIDQNEWKLIPSLNEERSDHASFSLNGKIYVVGGYSEDYSTIRKTVEVFDPKDENAGWKLLPHELNAGRGDFSAIVIGQKAYVVGGFGDGWKLISEASLEEFDPVTESWQVKKTMWHPRGDKAATVWKNTLFVSGGEVKVGPDSFAVQKTEQYNPETNSWRLLTPLPSPRFRAAAVTMKDCVFVLGGHDNNCVPVNNMDVYGSNCGIQEKEEDKKDNQDNKDKNRTGLVVAIVVCVVVVLGALLFVITRRALFVWKQKKRRQYEEQVDQSCEESSS